LIFACGRPRQWSLSTTAPRPDGQASYLATLERRVFDHLAAMAGETYTD